MNRARIFIPFLALTFAVATLAPAPSLAFRMAASTAATGWSSNASPVTCDDDRGFDHWETRFVTWYLDPSGQGWNKATAIQGALQTWTNAAESDFVLSYGGTRFGGYRLDDGVNTLVWGVDGQCDSLSCHAITAVLVRQDAESGRVVTQSDILFNANSNLAFQWMTNNQFTAECWNVQPGMMLDTQGIATHELGHSIGLHHPLTSEASYTIATMGRSACTTDARTLETDDRNGLTCVERRYPQDPNYDGNFDTASCASIVGWSRDENRPNRTTYVEIVEDMPTGPDRVFATVLANLLRTDIPNEGPGTRHHGFNYTPVSNDGLFNRQWHTIYVRHSGTGEPLFSGPKQIICGSELLAGLGPSQALSTGGLPYEVATQFSSSVPGRITELGYSFSFGETGPHKIRLWSDGGTELTPPGGVTLNPSPFFQGIGWAWVQISPVSIAANTRYRVSINTTNVQSKTPCGFSTPYTANAPLTAHQGFWVGGASGTFPNISSCSNFFVSVRFDS